ncbi:putative DNA topoisomerase (ATP-hydrolyzing) [Rosa chinensis]|uniref:Putative DNA topoisomerase (ATP-hydrolyzing) n=2 Tax=Rosa chinensis TaxID=74649 RepID=A0A2P6RJC3_ROSCH|nr:putative DNA topoisomerase (ATP-hydrolyzing) [Rosa chinensis]
MAYENALIEDPNRYEVKDLSIEEVQEKLEALKKKLDDGSFSCISRDKSNVTYGECSDGVKRLTVKDINKRSKPGDEKRKNIRLMVDLILKFFQANKRETHRGVFYVGNNTSSLFRQKDEYEILDDICSTIRCSSSSLYVDASVRGVVAGLLSFELGGHETFCTSRDDGVPIPLNSDIKMKNRGAKFILVVENKSAFNTLMQDKFYNDYPCIIITGMGMPEVATRRFLKLLSDNFGLPVYGLFDCDPEGIKMFTIYTVGSYEDAFDSVNLTWPYMTWLGVWPSDLCALDIPCKDLSPSEIALVDYLLREDFVKENPRLVEELEHMKITEKKANLEALKEFGPTCLSKYYLPYKLNYLLTAP